MSQDQPAARPTSHVHQIYITDDMDLPESMPALFEEHAAILKRLYPSSAYKMWSGNDLRAFIDTNFDADVLATFDKLRSYAYKADLARLCLLHVFGGLYVDVAVRFVKHFVPPESYGLGIFAEYQERAFRPQIVQNCIIWSEPRRPELMAAIRAIIQNCHSLYYGDNPLYPTGPALFGKICVTAEGQRPWQPNGSTQWIGVSTAIGDGPVPDAKGPNVAYVAPNGETVAVRVKNKGGDLTFAGAQKVNNYNTIWESGRVYSEVEHVWPLGDVDLVITGGATKTEAGVRLAEDEEAEITFSPGIDLTPGCHRFAVVFSDFVGESRNVAIKALDRDGQRVLFERLFRDVTGLSRERMTLMFGTANNHRNIQIKLVAGPDFLATVKSIAYIQVPQ